MKIFPITCISENKSILFYPEDLKGGLAVAKI